MGERMTINGLLDLLRKSKCEIDVRSISCRRSPRPVELTDTERQALANEAANEHGMNESKATLKFNWAKDRLCISSVVGNETRANISILVKIPGTCELPDDRPSNLPKTFETFIWRNVAIVKDGELSVETLPVALSKDAYDMLSEAGMMNEPWAEGHVYKIDLTQFALTSWKGPLDPEEYAQDHLNLLYAKATRKVLRHLIEQYSPKEHLKTIREMYGEESAKWLESMGMTDNGYAPKTERKEHTESYEARELSIKTIGMDIPSVNALLRKIEGNKKLNAGDEYLKTVMSQVTEALDGLKTDKEKLEWLEATMRKSSEEIDRLSSILEAKRMAIIADGAWFKSYGPQEDGITVALIETSCGCRLKIALKTTKTNV